MHRRAFLGLLPAAAVLTAPIPVWSNESPVRLREHRLDAVPLGVLLRQMDRWRHEGRLNPHVVESYWGAFIGYVAGVDSRLYRSEVPAYVWWLEAEWAGKSSIVQLFASPDPLAIIEPGWHEWLADFAPETPAEWEMALPLYSERFKMRQLCDYLPDWPPDRMSHLVLTPNALVDRLLEERRGIVFGKPEMASLLRAAGVDPGQARERLFGYLGGIPEDSDYLNRLTLGGQTLWDILDERAIRRVYTPYDAPESATRLAHLAMAHRIVI